MNLRLKQAPKVTLTAEVVGTASMVAAEPGPSMVAAESAQVPSLCGIAGTFFKGSERTNGGGPTGELAAGLHGNNVSAIVAGLIASLIVFTLATIALVASVVVSRLDDSSIHTDVMHEHTAYLEKVLQIRKLEEMQTKSSSDWVRLGEMFDGSRGIDEFTNAQRARYAFENATKCGDPVGMYKLALLYENGHPSDAGPNTDGHTLERDFQKARVLYNNSARMGYAPAQFNLASMYESGTCKYNPSLAAFWNLRSALSGYAPAEKRMGYFYSNGFGVAASDEQALEMFRLALEHGESGVEGYIADMYLWGKGTGADPAAAIKLYQRGSKSDPLCILRLGYLHETGLGPGGRDSRAAVRCYRTVIQMTEHSSSVFGAEAKYRLGLMFRDGRGVAKDRMEQAWLLANAVKELRDCTTHGDYEDCYDGWAMFLAARAYQRGIGVPASANEARKLYAQCGDKQAHERHLRALGVTD